MEIEEIVHRLEVWRKQYYTLMVQYDALHKLTGASPDCELMQSIFDVWDAYTSTIGEIVGDENNWMEWYQNECDMGCHTMKVKNNAGKELCIRTLRQLARVISEKW